MNILPRMLTHREITQLLQQALTPINKEWYSIDVCFNRDIEKVKIHKKHIDDIVQEILLFSYNGPRCTLYDESFRRLTNEQDEIEKGKYANLDIYRYDQLKRELLDTDLIADPTMFEKFKSLGPNPTSMIDYDNKTRFHFNNLLRKQWRSKRDSDANKDRLTIMKEMIDALHSNPKTAFITNRYLPSAIRYYRDRD